MVARVTLIAASDPLPTYATLYLHIKVSLALHQYCLTAVTVMKMMVVAVDGRKKWTRNVAPCSSLHLHVCCYIYVTIMLVIIKEKLCFTSCQIVLKVDVDSPQQQQQQQTLLQSDYIVEVAMEGDGEKKILYKKNS